MNLTNNRRTGVKFNISKDFITRQKKKKAFFFLQRYSAKKKKKLQPASWKLYISKLINVEAGSLIKKVPASVFKHMHKILFKCLNTERNACAILIERHFFFPEMFCCR